MNRLKTLVLICTLSLASMSVQAMAIVTQAPCENSALECATGIQNLVADGVFYDVAFKYDTYSNLLVSDPGVATFEFQAGAANSAASAIVDALNLSGLGQIFAGPSTGIISFFSVEWLGIDPFPDGAVTSWTGAIGENCCLSTNRDPDRPDSWAIFTAAEIPLSEPGTLSLLAIGLLVVAWVRRRKTA